MAKNPDSRRKNGVRRPGLSRPAWLPIPILLGVMAVLWAADLRTAYESQLLLTAFNFVFSTVASLLVVILVGRSFLVGGTPGLLLLGCGVLVWGAAGTVVPALLARGVNVTVSIHNILIWLSALCHLTGAILSLKPRRAPRWLGLILALAYAGAACVVWLVVMLGLEGWTPVFFVQGQGGTPVRGFVLGSATVMFAFTAAMLRLMNRRPPSAFVRWYGLALLLVATGLFGIMIEPVHGGVLSWTGRAAQFLGGAYMLVAALASMRESGFRGVSLTAALQEVRQRYEGLLDLAADGIVVHEFVSPTARGRFMEANPAVCRLLGYTPAEMRELTPLDILAPEEKPSAPLDAEVMRRAGVLRHEKTLVAKDGRRIPTEISTRMFEQDNRQMVMSVIRDVAERKKAEAELAKVHAQLETLLMQSPVGFAYLDRELRFMLVNERLAEMNGLPSAAHIGKRVHEIVPALAPAIEEVTGQILATGQPVRDYEFVGDTALAPGVIRYWSENWYPLRDHAGAIIGFGAVVMDITERKRTEEALREAHARAAWLARLPEENPNPVLRVSAEGTVLYRNPAAAEVTGWACETGGLVGEPFLSLVGRAMTEGREVRQDVELGETSYLVWAVPFPSEHYANLYGRDITERKQAEESLQKANEQLQAQTEELRASEETLRDLNATLESKVAQRTAQLQWRARQLQKLTLEVSQAEDRERKRMAEILHDDLQQIIAGAKFQLGLLRNRVKYDVSLQALAAQIDQMLKDAIEKSRGLSHELSPVILHHGEFTETLGWLANQMQAKHGLVVHVHANGQAHLQSDAIKAFLYKTVQELLFNVVKHARVKEARIRVRRCGQHVCLSVSDRGRGFDPQGLREAAGFGLLSIRERIELLGGRMKIKSAKGKGSTFFVVVPDSEKPEDRRQRTEDSDAFPGPSSVLRPPSSKPRLRVLLADDHKIVREGLRSLLSDEPDVEIVGEAAHGREAVDLALRLEPDVVIMDVSMPLIDGDIATRQIKEHLPKTRIVALSTYNEPEMIGKMYQAGAESYVLKTASAEELLAAIRGKPPRPQEASGE